MYNLLEPRRSGTLIELERDYVVNNAIALDRPILDHGRLRAGGRSILLCRSAGSPQLTAKTWTRQLPNLLFALPKFTAARRRTTLRN
jgi:hypothetical protein